MNTGFQVYRLPEKREDWVIQAEKVERTLKFRGVVKEVLKLR